ncbi:unnamed protein product, partial [Porites evermanni]
NSEQILRKANKELKDEVAELKVKLEKVLKELSEQTEECKLNVGNGVEVLSPDKTKSVEFVLDRNDDLIAFKFVRRLAKDQVMAARKKVGGLKAKELGFAADINVKYLNIYDHLMPRLQALYHEAKKSKRLRSVTETKITNSNENTGLSNIPGYVFELVPTPLACGGVGLFVDETLSYSVLEKT